MGVLPTKNRPPRCTIEAEVRRFNHCKCLPLDVDRIAIDWDQPLSSGWNREVIHFAAHRFCEFMRDSDNDALVQYRDMPIGQLAKICSEKIRHHHKKICVDRASSRAMEESNTEDIEVLDKLKDKGLQKVNRARRRARRLGVNFLTI